MQHFTGGEIAMLKFQRLPAAIADGSVREFAAVDQHRLYSAVCEVSILPVDLFQQNMPPETGSKISTQQLAAAEFHPFKATLRPARIGKITDFEDSVQERRFP